MEERKEGGRKKGWKDGKENGKKDKGNSTVAMQRCLTIKALKTPKL